MLKSLPTPGEEFCVSCFLRDWGERSVVVIWDYVGLFWEKERLVYIFKSCVWTEHTHTHIDLPHVFPETEAEVWILGMLFCWILLRAPRAEIHTLPLSPDLSLNASSLCSLRSLSLCVYSVVDWALSQFTQQEFKLVMTVSRGCREELLYKTLTFSSLTLNFSLIVKCLFKCKPDNRAFKVSSAINQESVSHFTVSVNYKFTL